MHALKLWAGKRRKLTKGKFRLLNAKAYLGRFCVSWDYFTCLM